MADRAPSAPTATIDEILVDLMAYVEPKFLKDEFAGQLDLESANIDEIKKYQELLFVVRDAWRKTLQYAQYFEDFYPPSSSSIQNFEALSHHIHAYLQDMTLLKNKIEVLFGTMKNDVRKIASNKDETDEFFRAGVEKTKEVFSSVSEHRDPHHHRGARFYDGDLLKAQNAHGALEMFQDPVFGAMLNPARKPELVTKFEAEQKESFEAGKARWVKMAKRNDEQVSGYLNAILSGIRPTLYQFLNIQPVRGLREAMQRNT